MRLKRGERSQGRVGHLGVGVGRHGSHALGEHERAGGSLWIRIASQRGWGHPFLSCPTVCILRKGSVTVESLGRERFCSVAAGWGEGGASLFSVAGWGRGLVVAEIGITAAWGKSELPRRCPPYFQPQQQQHSKPSKNGCVEGWRPSHLEALSITARST